MKLFQRRAWGATCLSAVQHGTCSIEPEQPFGRHQALYALIGAEVATGPMRSKLYVGGNW